jgi:pimeloyl-ACP methyl ester carboxylesterase
MTMEGKQLKTEYIGANGRASLIDISFTSTPQKGVVVFAHGYKGYKDWGAWQQMEQYFLSNDWSFCKFNFSHNGETTNQPIDFPDLAAFADNRYSYELFDLHAVIEFINELLGSKVPIYLVGHSRGGGMVLLLASHPQVKAIATLAAVADFEERFINGQSLLDWKKNGIYHVENKRTKQMMPHHFSFYEDFFEHKEKLHIENVLKAMISLKPMLHIHGKNDEAVNFENARRIASWSKGKILLFENANHTFGSAHPWSNNALPNDLEKACEAIVEFFNGIE